MPAELNVPSQLPAYMVGTTVVRILIMLIGVSWVARITPIKKMSKIAGVFFVSGVLVGWTLLIISLGRNDFFRIDANTTFPPPIVLGVMIPIIAGYAAFRNWNTLRQIIHSVPQHWLIGVQAFRITGGAILILYLRGLMPGEFAIPAGVGDILTGVTAIPVAYYWLKQKPRARKIVRLWNLAGILDFAIAVPLGILTSPSPIQLLAKDAPNVLTTTYPVVLFPAFSVPVGIILHLYSLALLKKGDERTVKSTSQKASWRLVLLGASAAFLYATVYYVLFPLLSSRPLGFQVHQNLRQVLNDHPVGLYIHIVPSMAAIILGPFQFLKRIRERRLKLHRLLGRIYLFGVLFGGLGGLYMSAFTFAGPAAQAGFATLAILWLYTGYMAYTHIRQGQIEAHREWMIRNYALTFAAVTLRLYTRSLIVIGLELPTFHAVNAWLCWVPNLIVAERLVRRRRTRRGETKVLHAASSQPS